MYEFQRWTTAREAGLSDPDAIEAWEERLAICMVDGELILIDEVLTPDSSRFWPMDEYKPGQGQPSFDKQFLRDYLSSLDWGKQPPPPPLPAEIVEKTAARYKEAQERLTV